MNERVLFEAAVNMADPAARRAYLDRACAGRPELRAQVEALLQSHDDAGSFLEIPVVPPPKTVVVPAAGDPAADDESDPDNGPPDLSFLQPSAKPGAIGMLGHYQILEILGHGSFGIVFKAFDDVLHRHVAIKVMNPQLAATSPPRKRFLREARAAAAIRHDNVVQVHSVEEQPLPYLVMEYISGQTLQQKLDAQGPLELPEILHLARQVACGLAAAHAIGLIHRDIKPGNILIEQGVEQRVKITDFGLARTADDASLTRTGVISGTPNYMAPEQAQGQPLDHRSDLFSLGSVIYVMACGRLPFRAGNMMAVLKRVIDDTPRPLREIIPELPAWLAALVKKLHAKQPADRFGSAKEVGDLLARCLSDVQANRPVELPADLMMTTTVVSAVETGAGVQETAAPVGRLNASDDFHPRTPMPPHPRTSLRRAWPTIAVVALIAFVGLGLTEATGVTQLTATVLRLTTGSGTLVIETDDPNVKVTLDGEEVQIQGAGVEQLTLKPGQYKIAALKDGKPVSQELVTITRGGKQVVRVTLEGIETTVSRDPKGSSISSTDPDRRAAEWVLSVGGIVMVTQSNQTRQIDSVNDLPRAPFQLTWVDTDRSRQVSGKLVTDSALTRFSGCRHLKYLDLRYASLTDAGLENFKECKKLENLSLGNTEITDTGLAHFRDCRELQQLRLYGTGVTGSGLQFFKDCKKLVLLYLGDTLIGDDDLANFQVCKLISALELNNTQVTDRGLQYFKACQGLRHLDLDSTQVTDAGLENFRSCSEMQDLRLGNTKITDHGLRCLKDCNKLQELYLANLFVTDAGLSHLENFKSLKNLQLKDTQVTEAGVQKLAAALPQCRIEWDGGVIEPTMSADPDRRAAEWVLSVGGAVYLNNQERLTNSDYGLALRDPASLPKESFRLTGVDLAKNPKVTDDGLACFRDCKDLTELYLGGDPQVTNAGLIHFQNCKSLKVLALNSTQVTDAGLAHFKDCKKLTYLRLSVTQVTDTGLIHFQDCKHLTKLDLASTLVTDAGLATFQNCKKLKFVNLSANPQITNAGLRHLRDAKEIDDLYLSGDGITDAALEQVAAYSMLHRITINETEVTEAGVKKLAAALPSCRIEWDGGVIEPRESSDGWHGWPADAPPPAIAPFDAEQAQQHQAAWAKYLGVPVEYTNSLGMKFRLIPPGEFLMGSTAEEIEAALVEAVGIDWVGERIRSEGPRHQVILTQPIYLGVNEVTQAEYEKVMGTNPSHFASTGEGKNSVTGLDTTSHPVEMISWETAVDFCAKISARERLKPFDSRSGENMNRLEGTGYRLPAETEWEYACRAGTATRYWTGDRDESLPRAAWVGTNAGGRTHPVGKLLANPFGLYDMHGNVWEWVQDGWEPSYDNQVRRKPDRDKNTPSSAKSLPVYRGGWYSGPLSRSRSAFRHCPFGFGFQSENLGFRVVLPVDAVQQALKQTPQAADPDRAAAEWVLSIGGRFEIQEANSKPHPILPGESLPQGEFQLTYIDIQLIDKFTAEGMENLADCEHLMLLSIGHENLTNAALSHIHHHQHLEHLYLNGRNFTDEGLAVFRDCVSLKYLGIYAGGSGKVTDAGLQHFQNSHELTELYLEGTNVTSNGLSFFRERTNVTSLNFNQNHQINDEALAVFRNCKNLRVLHLNQPDVTDKGLDSFEGCDDLASLSIGQYMGNITDAGLVAFRSCKNLTSLALQAPLITDRGLSHFRGCEKLQTLYLNSAVTDNGLEIFWDCKVISSLLLDRAKISDASLPVLAGWENLTQANLSDTRVSQAGFIQLKQAFPNCQITWSEPNRTTAKLVLDLGGTVEIGTPGQTGSRSVATEAEFPNEFFQVRRISLAGAEKLLGELPAKLALLSFAEFDRLESLDLTGNKGFPLANLVPIHGLKELSLAKTEMNDGTLQNLPKLPTLDRLHLDENNFEGGGGLPVLAQQPNLTELSLAKTNLSDAALKFLPKLPRLKRLILDGNDLKGPGLASLKEQPALSDLSLKQTKVTAAKIDELKQALPQCRIAWDGGVVEP